MVVTDDGRVVWWNGVDRFLAGKHGGGPKGTRFLAPAAAQRACQRDVVRAPPGYPKLGNVVAYAASEHPGSAARVYYLCGADADAANELRAALMREDEPAGD